MFSAIRRVYYENYNSIYKDDGFRNEIKYTLTPCEHMKLRDYFSGFMAFDVNAGIDGEYTVKSYYFDTLYFDDYYEKVNGVYERQKYRVRTYGDLGQYRLEKKQKRGLLNKKLSGEICADDADMLIKGHTEIITGNKDTDLIIAEMRMKGCRSSVYTEYIRQAFTVEEIGLRITFDREISAVYGNYGLSETRPEPFPIFYDGEVIMEIKYEDSLPRWLERAVRIHAPGESSTSKYAQSLDYILG